MILQTSLEQAFRTLRANKTRSALTVLGVVIGIASVIILVSAGRGAEQLIVQKVQGAGSNLIFVFAGGSDEGTTPTPASSQGIVITSLTAGDAEALRNPRLAPSVAMVSPEVRGIGKVQRGAYEKTITFLGVSPDYFEIRDTPVATGEAFTQEQVSGLASVIVLGPKVAASAFGEDDPIGQTVRLNQRSFRVIGVLEAKGIGSGGIDQDEVGIIPYTTAQKLVLGVDYLTVIDVSAKTPELVQQATDEIEAVLLDRHRINDPADADFTIFTQQDVLTILQTVTGALTLFLAAIAAISLLVGGIGIMNIMLVAVTERTREIGLRKAVGAKRKDILVQFLVEALALTLVGGIAGIILGISVSLIIARIGGWGNAVTPGLVLLATGVSAFFGIVFGIYPASKASKLNPIDALRYE